MAVIRILTDRTLENIRVPIGFLIEMITSEALIKINLNSTKINQLLRTVSDEVSELSAALCHSEQVNTRNCISELQKENQDLEKQIEKYKGELFKLRAANGVPEIPIPKKDSTAACTREQVDVGDEKPRTVVVPVVPVIPVDINEVPSTLPQAIQIIGALKTRLITVEEKELWFHTQMKLRYTLEKMELMTRPADTSKQEWDAVTRVEKWNKFFAGSDDFGFTDFVSCAKSVLSDPQELARSMNRIYSVLNARIHNYLATKQISKEPFLENNLNLLATCLDAVDVI